MSANRGKNLQINIIVKGKVCVFEKKFSTIYNFVKLNSTVIMNKLTSSI